MDRRFRCHERFLLFIFGWERRKYAGLPQKKPPRREEAIELTHIAFPVDTAEEVDALAKNAHKLGYPVILEPHQTGDGYYEACILDPDGNRVEITVTL